MFRILFAITSLLMLGSTATIASLATSFPEIADGLPLLIAPPIALAVVAFYYRKGRGTKLWLPAPAASYITGRAKKTKSGIEAFGLGATSAIMELPFTIAPFVLAGFMFQTLPSNIWSAASHTYAVVIALPLLFVAFYLSSGHKVSAIQKWREEAKNFLRWTSAAALLLLTIYIAVLIGSDVTK